MMEQILDFVAASTVFLVALAFTAYAYYALTLPPPVAETAPPAPPTLNVSNGVASTPSSSRVWIIVFREDGAYTIEEASTPARLPPASFVAVFTGKEAAWTGTPPRSLNGYVYAHGFTPSQPQPPYIRIRDGHVVEVKNREPTGGKT